MKKLLGFVCFVLIAPAVSFAVDSSTYINGQGFNNLQSPSGYGTSGQLLKTNGDGTSSWVTGAVGTLTGVTAGAGLTGGGSSGSVTLTSVVSTYSVTAAGTAYSFTASSATLDFGTTDPTLTLTQAGTYLIIPRVNVEYNSTTFAASRTLTLKLRRTNNTAADVTSTAMSTRVTTTVTDVLGIVNLPQVIYTTSNTDDALAITGFISVVPTAGTLDATEASIVAVRLF